jgi:hypothetical protein
MLVSLQQVPLLSRLLLQQPLLSPSLQIHQQFLKDKIQPLPGHQQTQPAVQQRLQLQLLQQDQLLLLQIQQQLTVLIVEMAQQQVPLRQPSLLQRVEVEGETTSLLIFLQTQHLLFLVRAQLSLGHQQTLLVVQQRLPHQHQHQELLSSALLQQLLTQSTV